MSWEIQRGQTHLESRVGFNLRVRPLSTSILKENTGDRVKKGSPIQAEVSVGEHAGWGGCVSEEWRAGVAATCACLGSRVEQLSQRRHGQRGGSGQVGMGFAF